MARELRLLGTTLHATSNSPEAVKQPTRFTDQRSTPHSLGSALMLRFDPSPLVDLSESVAVAFVLATAIGAERQYRQRSAGLRTNVLVAVGAAAFVSIGSRLNGDAGATQLAAYVVSGIGFLGAGVIMKDGGKVWGLNTAATL
jgi:putative Mg2+ transporter-C (MgtC) family protein